MFSYDSLPPPKTILTTAASVAATAVLLRSVTADLIPTTILTYFTTLFHRLSAQLTIIIHDTDGLTPNHLFHSANVYLGNKLSPSTLRINVNKPENESEFTITVDRNQPVVDFFERVKCEWELHTRCNDNVGTNTNTNVRTEVKYFELSFHKKYRELVLKKYLPYIVTKAKEIKDECKAVKLHTVDYGATDYWGAVVMNHPATFDTMAMDKDKKDEFIEDIEMFIKRREYYKRVGKAWKRGYLFYGPPGTGKSSLVAAMANHLKFDVYDLDLREVQCNSDLRRLLIGTKSRSIIVIEDIDCNVGLQSREFEKDDPNKDDDKITLSGLLNFIDGLWSSCGDERIIVFTTNYKERLDAALLRPGRMDVHLEMSYCTYDGFKVLASTYLQVKEEDKPELFGSVKEMLKKVKVTPAEIAGELMKSVNVDMVLNKLVHWLQNKEAEQMTT